MPSVEELLSQVEPFAETGEAHESEIYCVIHPDSRTIEVPEEYQLLGVENDKRVERLYFQCPKIVGDNQDLSQDYILFINYVNANGDPDAYKISDMQVEGENITFSWLLEENVTKYRGNIQFAFGAIKPGDEVDDPDKNRWNTTINTDCTCLVGLKCTQQVAESNPDALTQIWAAIDELKAGGGGSGTPGKDGREVELQNSGTAIQWRYVGESEWIDLVQLSELKGDKGDKGDPGENAQNGIPSGGTTGQVLAKKTDSDYDIEWKDENIVSDEQVENAVNQYFTDNPEVVTNIPDGSVTEEKLSNDLLVQLGLPKNIKYTEEKIQIYQVPYNSFYNGSNSGSGTGASSGLFKAPVAIKITNNTGASINFYNGFVTLNYC